MPLAIMASSASIPSRRANKRANPRNAIEIQTNPKRSSHLGILRYTSGYVSVLPTNPSLSVLVPLYNEEEFIATLLERVLAAPLPNNLGREIIVTDDGST